MPFVPAKQYPEIRITLAIAHRFRQVEMFDMADHIMRLGIGPGLTADLRYVVSSLLVLSKKYI